MYSFEENGERFSIFWLRCRNREDLARRTRGLKAIADGMYRRAFDFMIEVADSALVATDSTDPTVRWTGSHRSAKP